VAELLASHPTPAVSEASIRAREYAAYAFYRLGYATEAARIAERDYQFMISRRLYVEALYSASLRTDIP
jgi:hypothetical protein